MSGKNEAYKILIALLGLLVVSAREGEKSQGQRGVGGGEKIRKSSIQANKQRYKQTDRQYTDLKPDTLTDILVLKRYGNQRKLNYSDR